ncbi:MAG: hypothetical protein ACKOFN_00430 [Vulcanococcus sp.]
MLHSGYPAAQRLFRLTNARGLPHPVLDESFESREQALEVALQWLLQQGLLDPHADPREQEKQLALQVGLEMSTPSGDWRTLRHAGFTGWRSLSA